MCCTVRFVGWLLFAAVCSSSQAAPPAAASGACVCQHCRSCECREGGGWFVAETANFSVWSRQSAHAASAAAARCESLRSNLSTQWGIGPNAAAWHPKCAVVVHAQLADYRRELGNWNDESVGCTTITVDGGRVLFRRVDIRADAADWQVNALPHELTHVLLADTFADTNLPEWLKEGLAMQSENAELHERRHSVLAQSLILRRVPQLAAHVSAVRGERGDPHLWYAVSHSLITHLDSLAGREQLLQFAKRAAADGYSAALRDTYGIDGGISEWERLWLNSLRGVKPVPLASR